MLNKKSFTYLELATTIVIITAISTVMLVSFSHSRQKTRDVRRQADLRNLAAALSWYYTDKLVFPVWTSGCIEDSGASGYPVAFSNPAAGFLGTWMERIPKDPLWKVGGPTGYCYYYKTDANGANYHLIARMEKDTEKAAQDGGGDPNYYEVFSSGGSELASIATNFFDVKTKMGGTLTVFSWPVSGTGFNDGTYVDGTTSYYSTSPYGVELASTVPTNGLVGYWKMDENTTGAITTGTTTADSSGNNNTGTASNVNGTGMAWTTGKFNGAISFDGVDDYVNVAEANNAFAFEDGPWSINMWIKFNGLTTKQAFWGSTDFITGEHTFFIMVDGQTIGSGNSYSFSFGTYPFTTNTWYLITFNKNPIKTLSAYVNSVKLANDYLNYPAYGASQSEFRIGRQVYDNAWPFNGLIDEVAIWSRALDATEIANLYNLGPRAPSGSYLSKIYDSEASAPLSTRWNKISWTRSGEPTDTIKFQVRSCLNSDCSDGTWSSDILTSGSTLSVPDHRYFQFKAEFANEGDGTTPYLNSVTVEYQK